MVGLLIAGSAGASKEIVTMLVNFNACRRALSFTMCVDDRIVPHGAIAAVRVTSKACIVAANLQRRNLMRGQAVMALAMIYPEPAKGGNGDKG